MSTDGLHVEAWNVVMLYHVESNESKKIKYKMYTKFFVGRILPQDSHSHGQPPASSFRFFRQAPKPKCVANTQNLTLLHFNFTHG